MLCHARAMAVVISRRCTLATSLALAISRNASADDSFDRFLAGVRHEAQGRGVSSSILDASLGNLVPNRKVLDLDRSQPEFTQTWEHYRDVRLSPTRVAQGRAAARLNRDLLAAIRTDLQVDAGVILGVWGLETNYGSYTGGFGVVDALATLAWDGRRAAYFRSELLAALSILQHGDVTPERMTGSYAGAMGQPQFMPTSFDRYAVDFDGDGRRDIWNDRSDVLASIGNYLARSGWHAGQPWGRAVRLPPAVGLADAGKGNAAPLSAWARRGVHLADGNALPRTSLSAYLLLPGGEGGDAFLAYPNFAAIRRYNPSDFYALAVGMLGNLALD